MVDKKFWQGKKVFITGHTGFKGGWMSVWLNHLQANVKGYSLNPDSKVNFFEVVGVDNLIDSEINDIRDYSALKKAISDFAPDVVFHMAAQPLVRESYINPIETYQTNVIGTANLLDCCLNCESVKIVINITTDKCYENDGRKTGYREDDPMGGYDPYSSSKGCSELLTTSYYNSFYKKIGKGLCSARAGNVIGGGDWSKDRLIPDILGTFSSKKNLLIRNKHATRPWQGYLILAQNLYIDPAHFSGGYNFGPLKEDIKNVEWIVNKMSEYFPNSTWNEDQSDNPHEADFLTLNIKKADKILNWQPSWNINTALKKIVDWHNAFNKNQNMFEHTLNDINQYESKLLQK